METKTYFKVDSKNVVRTWSIKPMYDESGFYMYSGVEDGALITKFVKVIENQSGRDIHEQIDLEVASRTKRKLDSGYKEFREQAISEVGLDASGNLRPMLAHKYDQKKIDWDRAFMQIKYDGHRCLIEIKNGVARAYSRKGLPITTMDHILESLHGINEDMILDGELYIHGKALQEIASYVKKKRPESAQVQYIVYDIVDQASAFSDRFNRLGFLFDTKLSGALNIDLAPTHKVNSHQECMKLFHEFRENGYEGGIVRISKDGYDVGKRSRQVLKVKQFHDAEFTIIDVEESADGWGVLVCKTSDNTVFRCTAPGTHAQKTEILKNKKNYIGRDVTVEFSHLTNDGVPFHPVATRFRVDI